MSRHTKTLMEKFEDLLFEANADQLEQMHHSLRIAVKMRNGFNPGPEPGAAPRKSRGKGTPTTGTAPLGETGTAEGK